MPSAYEIARAERVGRFFARAGKPIRECPFNPIGDGHQRVLTVHFVRGYLTVKPARFAIGVHPASAAAWSGAAATALETVRLAEAELRAMRSTSS
jgi:hypothetical protein